MYSRQDSETTVHGGADWSQIAEICGRLMSQLLQMEA